MSPEQLANVYLKAACKADPFADDAVLMGLAAVGEAVAARLEAQADSFYGDEYTTMMVDAATIRTWLGAA